MSLSQYLNPDMLSGGLLGRDESLLSSGYEDRIKWMKDQQLRQNIIREQKKAEEELRQKQSEGGVAGAIPGLIIGGGYGLFTGDWGTAGKIAFEGGMSGYKAGAESGKEAGTMQGLLSSVGAIGNKLEQDKALKLQQEQLSQQAQQEFDKSALSQGLVPISGLKLSGNEIPVNVGGQNRYYKPFISPEKQAEMDLKASLASQSALDKREANEQKLINDNYWKSLNAQLRQQSLDLTRMGINTNTALRVAQIGQENQNRIDRLDQHQRDVIAKNRTSQAYTEATQGLKSVNNAIDIYQKNPGVVSVLGVPGRVFGFGKSGTFESEIANATDIISRSRSGAALTKRDEKIFDRISNPQWYNDKENIDYKLKTMRAVYSEILDRLENPYRKNIPLDNLVPKPIIKQKPIVKPGQTFQVGGYKVRVK